MEEKRAKLKNIAADLLLLQKKCISAREDTYGNELEYNMLCQ